MYQRALLSRTWTKLWNTIQYRSLNVIFAIFTFILSGTLSAWFKLFSHEKFPVSSCLINLTGEKICLYPGLDGRITVMRIGIYWSGVSCSLLVLHYLLRNAKKICQNIHRFTIRLPTPPQFTVHTKDLHHNKTGCQNPKDKRRNPLYFHDTRKKVFWPEWVRFFECLKGCLHPMFYGKEETIDKHIISINGLKHFFFNQAHRGYDRFVWQSGLPSKCSPSRNAIWW